MALINIKNLSYKYPLGEEYALKNVNMTVEQGDFYAVIGPNGSGKSTLAYAIRGFIPQFYQGEMNGSVFVNGREIRRLKLGEICLEVGMVFQNPFTQISGAALTVFEEIAYGLENLGVEVDQILRRVKRVMAVLKIEDLQDRNPLELSGGQQQKVAIASILVMEPQILLLDEPTSQLDPLGTEEVFKAVEIMKEWGITIIMIEHKLELLARFARKVLVLKDGAVLFDGSLEAVFGREDFYLSGLKPPIYTEITRKLGHRLGRQLEPALTYEQCRAALAGIKEGVTRKRAGNVPD